MTIERIWNIYPEEGEPLTLQPWPECPGILHLVTTTEDAETWYGVPISIVMTPNFARSIGKSLIEAADWMEKGDKQ